MNLPSDANLPNDANPPSDANPPQPPVPGDQTAAPTAIVLAAGKGTRMNSDLPKVLCPVVGRPMIHFVLDALAKAGVEQQIVVVGYQAEMVRQALAERNPAVEFATQAEQLGTGHAVQMCRDHLAGRTGATIVLAGDSPLVQPKSLETLLAYFDKHRPALLLGTLHKSDPTGLGRIVRDADGNFTGIVEHKDATEDQRAITEVNMSTYVFDTPALLTTLEKLRSDNAQNEYYLTDCASLMRQAGQKVEAIAVLQDCESMSINDPEQLDLVDQTMQSMGYA